ncbi:MAG: hypothetical protein ACI4CA_05190, partial [Bacteroides sp.]
GLPLIGNLLLRHKQYRNTSGWGSATFAEGNGKNGLLATATFNVPGLKGLVTKIYFIDVNEKGDNGFDKNSLTPGTLVYYQDSPRGCAPG